MLLLTNDDGVHAPGLVALAAEFARDGITVCAPRTQKSAVASSITLTVPLTVQQWETDGASWVAVDGTPADAVKLAMRELLPSRPDGVLSGINSGLNTGSNILYSGTVAAALEGALHGVPSFAVSVEWGQNPDYARAARIARRVVEWSHGRFARAGVVININIPAAKRIKGFAVTREESTPYLDVFERRVSPRGNPYYWLCGNVDLEYAGRSRVNGNGGIPTDVQACAQGYVSITPLVRSLTSAPLLRRMRAARPPRRR